MNEGVFSLLDEVQADIADSRIERGSLMVKLDNIINSLEQYENKFQNRLKKENGKSKTKQPDEQKEEEITNSPT